MLKHRFLPSEVAHGSYLQVLSLIVIVAIGLATDASAFDLRDHAEKVVMVRAYSSQDAAPSDRLAGGSGVLLDGGYVLTAAHLAEGKADDGRRPVLKGTIGSSEGQDYTLSSIREIPAHDLMLLRFDPSVVRNTDFACLRDTGEDFEIGAEIHVVGFPETLVDGRRRQTFFYDDGRVTGTPGGNRINSGINITYGLSGAPVFTEEGALVGIVQGELTAGGQGTDTAIILPIDLIEPLLPLRAAVTCDRQSAVEWQMMRPRETLAEARRNSSCWRGNVGVEIRGRERDLITIHTPYGSFRDNLRNGKNLQCDEDIKIGDNIVVVRHGRLRDLFSLYGLDNDRTLKKYKPYRDDASHEFAVDGKEVIIRHGVNGRQRSSWKFSSSQGWQEIF